jgi:hypothetical protein
VDEYKSNPLLFINTFLRRAHEPYVSEEEYAKVATKERPKVYDLRWQVRVRKKFFNNQQKSSNHGNQEPTSNQ